MKYMSGGIRQAGRFELAGLAALVALLAVLGGWHAARVSAQNAKNGAQEIPTFQYDPTWPKHLPNNWKTGNIGAIFIDRQDHIWVAQRPGMTSQVGGQLTTSLSENYGLTGEGDCCFPAPPILEFDLDGNLVQSWGPIHDIDGKLIGKQVWHSPTDVSWPLREHGIFVDDKYLYIDDHFGRSLLLKFTRDGKKFVRRFGNEEAKSSNDMLNLAGPTSMFVDPKTNELYVADGYRNRRIIVFDAETGKYKRSWGAYGHKPPDGPQGGEPIDCKPVPGPVSNPDQPRCDHGIDDPHLRSQNFATVHCAHQSKDGLIYVCDRVNDRIQVFKTDGTFVKEGVVGGNAYGFGSVHDLAFSPDQRFLYVADGANKKIWIVRRDDLKVLGSFSSGGRMGGQVMVAHAIAVDSRGNVYVGETIDNNRVQRFKFVGMRPSTSTH